MLSLSNESVNPFISNIIIVYCTISGNSFKWLFKLKNKLNINKLLKILLNCNNHPIFSFSRYNVQYNASVNLKTHIKHKNLSLYVLKLWLKKIWKPIKNTENKMAKKERRKTTIHIFFQSRAVHNFSTSHFRCYFNAADNPVSFGTQIWKIAVYAKTFIRFTHPPLAKRIRYLHFEFEWLLKSAWRSFEICITPCARSFRNGAMPRYRSDGNSASPARASRTTSALVC